MVTWSLTHGSFRTNQGSSDFTGVSQDTVPLPTSWATTVAPTALEREASWNTVSASTFSGLPALRTPKPFTNTVLPSCTTTTARPGTPVRFNRPSARPSSLAMAASICPFGMGTATASGGGTLPSTRTSTAPAGTARAEESSSAPMKGAHLRRRIVSSVIA